MKKSFYLFSAGLMLCLSVGVVYAQVNTNSGSGQGNQDRQQPQDPTLHEDPDDGIPQGNRTKNKNKVTTQNSGEDSQISTATQNSEGDETETGKSNRSANARLHMSIVAESVETILSTGNRTGGIGQQISEIAKAQNSTQEEIEEALDSMDSRKGVLRAVLGSNTSALKDMKKLMQQNQVRIQQLQELQTQTQNQGEATQLQTVIQAMTDQNTALQEQVDAEALDMGWFGWLKNLFNN